LSTSFAVNTEPIQNINSVGNNNPLNISAMSSRTDGMNRGNNPLAPTSPFDLDERILILERIDTPPLVSHIS
jgi:hypothetical protein